MPTRLKENQHYTPTVMEVYRRRNGISQMAIAHALGVQQATVSHYENGSLNMSDAALKTVAEMLKVEPNLLLTPFVPEQMVETALAS